MGGAARAEPSPSCSPAPKARRGCRKPGPSATRKGAERQRATAAPTSRQRVAACGNLLLHRGVVLAGRGERRGGVVTYRSASRRLGARSRGRRSAAASVYGLDDVVDG